MASLLSNISIEHIIMFSINLFFVIILFFITMSNRKKYRRLKNKYDKFMNGLSGANIEQLLAHCIDKIDDLNIKNKDMENHINTIERNILYCIQKIGIVRYNAFDNVGSDLSFSIALLDNNEDGVVISGIYSRDSSSTYAKPITGAKSKYPLSAEEIQALEIARKTFREKN